MGILVVVVVAWCGVGYSRDLTVRPPLSDFCSYPKPLTYPHHNSSLSSALILKLSHRRCCSHRLWSLGASHFLDEDWTECSSDILRGVELLLHCIPHATKRRSRWCAAELGTITQSPRRGFFQSDKGGCKAKAQTISALSRGWADQHVE